MNTLFRDHSAIRSMPISAVICDARKSYFPIVYVNTAFEVLTGYSLEEVRGRSCKLLQQPGDNLSENEKIRHSLQNCLPIKSILTNYRKDGSRFTNKLEINPIVGDDGMITHFVGVQNLIKDIEILTDAQQLNAMHNQLTTREKEIFAALSEGMSNKSIALSLGISFRTVEKHRARLYEKLNISSTAQLVRYKMLLEQYTHEYI